MGQLASMTSEETLMAVLAKTAGLAAQFPREKVNELNAKIRAFMSTRGPGDEEPDDLRLLREEASEFAEMDEKVEQAVSVRKNERMPIEAVDIVLSVGTVWWRNFPDDISIFIANNLWGFEGAPYTEEQGLAYVTQKLEESDPGHGWQARIAVDELDGGEPKPIFDNAAARSMRAKTVELKEMGMPGPIILAIVKQMEIEVVE